MKKRPFILIVFLLLLLMSCSIQSKMNHRFKGQKKEQMDAYFQQEGTIVSLSSGIKYVEYTQSKYLKSMEIGKGVTSLDPMISPAVKKKQHYTFYLDAANRVTQCKYESVYERE